MHSVDLDGKTDELNCSKTITNTRTVSIDFFEICIKTYSPVVNEINSLDPENDQKIDTCLYNTEKIGKTNTSRSGLKNRIFCDEWIPQNFLHLAKNIAKEDLKT